LSESNKKRLKKHRMKKQDLEKWDSKFGLKSAMLTGVHFSLFKKKVSSFVSTLHEKRLAK
jgi:hypothetical protein